MNNLVDSTWYCSCGALNAAYKTECGNCEKQRNKIRSGYIGT
jgi:hypothetical protein